MKRCLDLAVCAFFAFAVSLFSTDSGRASDPLIMVYADRPPYYLSLEGGEIGGVVGGPIAKALDAAGIRTEWVWQRFHRQLVTIKRGKPPVCSPGWFKTHARESFAVFSDPVHRDEPQVIVIDAADIDLFPHKTLASLISDPNLRLGTKRGYSYGPYADSLIVRYNPPIDRTGRDIGSLIDLMQEDLFDYTMMAGEEFALFADERAKVGRPIHALSFPDVPPGNRRYLMCSRNIDPAVLEKFNAAFASLNDD